MQPDCHAPTGGASNMGGKNGIVWALFAASFLAGVIGQQFWPSAPLSPVDAAYALIGALLIFAWFRLDARQHGYRRSRWLDVGVILLAIVALPYYFFRSRGFRGGLLWSGLLLVLLVATSVATMAGQYATYILLQA